MRDFDDLQLEVGSNIFELIEFTVTKNGGEMSNGNSEGPTKPTVFGVNVAKVREVIRLPHISPVLTNKPEVMGVFNLRGVPVPAIHLAKVLGKVDEPVSPSYQVIVTEFSKRIAGFIVAGTRRIRRVNWDKILPPTSEAFTTITGMMLIENSEFLFILDFERILMEIEGFSKQVATNNAGGYLEGGAYSTKSGGDKRVKDPNAPLVIVVDDSPVARRAVCEMLRGFGFEVVEFVNGEQAWSALRDPDFAKSVGKISLVLSDVEMPRLDGYSLVMRIKEDPKLKHLPVILHSSLTGEANKERAKVSGADAYVSKLNRKEIVDALKRVLPNSRVEKEAS